MTREEAIKELLSKEFTNKAFYMAIEALKQPEIIYCKECKHYESVECGKSYCDYHETGVYDNDYCSYAERKNVK